MKTSIKTVALLAVAGAVLCAPALQAQSVGPDVIVGAITGVSNYGSVGNIAAFSFGTTSCNIGTQNLQWVASTNQHPVIAQQVYRIKDNRLEQIGLAWLKHGFLALTQNLCSTCNGQGGSVLGVGCSDPYGAGLNGSQSGLGARSEVNAATGYFPFPRVLVPPYPPVIGRRVQIKHADLDPALNAGATYIVECQYVTPDDAAAGNNNNNASYRIISVSPSGGSYNISYVEPTVQTKSAVEAWQDIDPFVAIETIDVPNDGRFHVAQRVEILGGGMRRFTWAVHNLNSDRSAGSFAIQLPPGATVANTYFHDVDYHSNEVLDNTDWTVSIASNGVVWQSTTTFNQDPNGNAIRWGTTYTFSLETDAIPTGLTLGLFKPGTPTSIAIAPIPFPTPTWQVNSAEAHLDIDGATNTAFTGPVTVTKSIASPGVFNLASTLVGQPFDIAVTTSPAVPDAYTTTGDQHFNLDLADPSFFFLNGFFGSTVAAPSAQIPFTTPAGVLSAQMIVLDPGAADGFFLSAAIQLSGIPGPPPTIDAVTPASAPVGTPITITGNDFVPTLTLTLGGSPLPTTSVTSTSVTFNYPAGVSCDTPLVLTNPDGQSASTVLNPTPVISNVINQSGPAAGGVLVLVTGTGFAPGTTLTIDGVPATVTTSAATIVIAITPPGTAGTVPLVLTTPGGCTVSSTYTYL